jgi:hypothetical protein
MELLVDRHLHSLALCGEHDHRTYGYCFKLDLLTSADYTVVVLTALQEKAFWKDVLRGCYCVPAVTGVNTIC